MPDKLPSWNLSTIVEDLIWADCDICKAVRFGIAIAAIVLPMVFGYYVHVSFEDLENHLQDLTTEILLERS